MFIVLKSRQNINMYGSNVSPCKTPATILKKSVVTTKGAKHCFHVLVKHHYSSNSSFGGDDTLIVFTSSMLS